MDAGLNWSYEHKIPLTMPYRLHLTVSVLRRPSTNVVEIQVTSSFTRPCSVVPGSDSPL